MVVLAHGAVERVEAPEAVDEVVVVASFALEQAVA